MKNENYATVFLPVFLPVFLLLFLFYISFAVNLSFADNISSADNLSSDNTSSGNVSIASASFNFSLSSSYQIKSNENMSIFRFRIKNNLTGFTTPFRIWMSSNLSWFVPSELNYSLLPDGFSEDGNPYWDIPPLQTNESMELSFTVRALVGLPDEVKLRAEPITRWDALNDPLACSNTSRDASAGFISAGRVDEIFFPFNNTPYYFGTYSGKNYTLAYMKDYGLFAVFEIFGNQSAGNQIEDFRVVSDRDIIQSVVHEYLVSLSSASLASSNLSVSNSSGITFNPKSSVSAIRSAISSKFKAETECRKLTGQEKYSCTDRESCRYACYSVQICSQVAQGLDFFDVLKDYNQSTTNVNKRLSDSLVAADSFAEAPDYSGAVNMFNLLTELNRAESAVTSHPLITVYGFCPQHDYSLPKQIGAKKAILDYLVNNCFLRQEEKLVNESFSAGSKLSKALESRPGSHGRTGIQAISGANKKEPELVLPFGKFNFPAFIRYDLVKDSGIDVRRNACCEGISCSLLGIERLLNICWQWWIFLILAIVLMIIFYLHWYIVRRKLNSKDVSTAKGKIVKDKIRLRPGVVWVMRMTMSDML